MTATEVSGLKVVETFLVPTGSNQKPNGVDNGVPAMYRQIIGLVLENGHKTYGCVHCDYVNDNVKSVRPHLNRHGIKGDGKTPRAQRVAAASKASTGEAPLAEVPALSQTDIQAMSIGDIARLVNRARRALNQAKELAEWRERALKAEGDLAALRDLIRGTG